MTVYNSSGTVTRSVIEGFDFQFSPDIYSLEVAPLPASAPMFGMALLMLAALGFVSKRLQSLAAVVPGQQRVSRNGIQYPGLLS
jgi:hypothetical protein